MQLSESFIKHTQELRAQKNINFFLTIVALHQNGWSLQDIAKIFGVSKSAVANWEKEGLLHKNQLMPLVPIKEQKSKPLIIKEKKPSFVPSTDQQNELFSLCTQASTVSRNTPIDAPSRIAASNLEKLLYKYNKELGVSYGLLAAFMGVTRRAVAQRVEKEKKRLTSE